MLRRLFAVLLVLVATTASFDVRADTRTDARRYFNRGMRAIDAGEYREGIDLLTRAYELRPHPNVLFNLGAAYELFGDLDNAVRSFEQYLASDPDDAELIEERVAQLNTRLRLRRMVDEGMAAISEGRYLEGVAFLQRAYSVRPHPNLLFNIARAYEQAGELTPAIDSYQRYLESKPKDTDEVRKRLAVLEARAKEKTTETSPEGGVADPQKVAEIVVSMLERQGVTRARTQVDPAEPLIVDTSTAAELKAKSAAGYDEVVVTASRREQSPLDAPNAVTVLTDEDIRLSGARSIPELLRRVPGMDVMAMSASDWNVSMRGFNRRLANKILVLIDGRTVYQDFLGATVWSSLSISLLDIERIEVVRGPGSAIYGAYAYTGIVNIITKRPEAMDGMTTELAAGNRNSVEGTLQYGKRAGPIGVRASVGYQRGDKFMLEFDPSRVDYTTTINNPEVSVDRARLDAEASYTLKDVGRFFVGGGLNSGGSEIYGVSALRNQAVDGLTANVRGGYESDFFSLLVFYDRIRADSTPQFFPTGSNDPGSNVSGDLIAVEPVFRPSFSLFGEHQLVLGAEFRHKVIDWTYLDRSHEEDFFALFVQDQWAITEQWTVLVSARLDKHPLIGFLGSPRGAVIFKPTPGQAIRLTVGTAFRQPTQAENYLNLNQSVSGLGVSLIGERNLNPERIFTVDAGYLNQGELGQFELVAYVNRVDNLIVRSDLVPTGPEETYDPVTNGFLGARSFYQNETSVYWAMGSELAARVYPVDGVDIGASYAFQYIFDEESGDRFTDSPMHKVNGWGQLRTEFGLDVGLSLSWTSDQVWNEEVANPDAAAPTDAITRVPLPLDSYFVLSGRVGYRLFDDQLELGVSANNITDFGDQRSRQHPLGNRVETRVLGTVTVRL